MNKTIKRLKRCIVAIGLLAAITSQAQITLTNIFSFNGTNGSAPFFLVQAGNNKFYGTTTAGGLGWTTNYFPSGYGSIFSITDDGTFSNLFFFDGSDGNGGNCLITPGTDGNFYGAAGLAVFELNPDGSMANSNLAPQIGSLNFKVYGIVQDHDGTLYGMRPLGGDKANPLGKPPLGWGAIYKIDTNDAYSTFLLFNGTNGSFPKALLLGADNSFYGITEYGGNDLGSSPTSGDGTIFRMDWSGNVTNVFLFGVTNGANPFWLVQGIDGDLYGITQTGGTYNLGTVFRLTTNGTLVWSYSLDGTNGDTPYCLTAGNDGNFYGLTCTGGSGYDSTKKGGYYGNGFGTVFRITQNGAFSCLVKFDGTNNVFPSSGTIVQGTDGNIYGTSGGGSYGQGAIFKLTLPACPCTNRLMLTSSYTFYDNPSFDFPEDGLIQASDGMLYGITENGGAFAGGSVFRMTLSGSPTTLVSFNGTNGDRPTAPPVQAADGNFYGTTGGGGSANYGTIYRMDSNGVLTTLFNFNGTNGAGAGGVSGLIVGNDGAFYGVTQAGGPNLTNVNGGDGTIFKITTNGDFTSLVSFDGTNGSEPVSIIQASDGNFYGTTLYGGIGAGTVFQMTPDGQINTLVRFNGTNGEGPSGIIQASEGCLYGTTVQGGASYTGAYPNFGNGTVFKITTNGDFTLLASFSATNGASPRGGLIEVCNGLFYGTAYSGGFDADPSGSLPAAGGGTVFQVTTNGDLTALLLLGVNPLMPANPLGRLLKASDGNYYGTSQSGGTTNFDSYDGAILSAGGIFAIRPVQAPVLQPLAQPGQLNLSWNAWAGYTYNVMYETNLTGSNWNLLSTVTPQTNGPTSFSDSIGPDAQRFYSVILQLP